MAKVAILVDGGYFLKRLPRVRRDVDARDPLSVVGAIEQLVDGHLAQLNELYHVANPRSLLYRCLFYDAIPYRNKGELPISRRAINYERSDAAKFRRRLFSALGQRPNFALRLGEVRKPSNSSWVMRPEAQKRLLNGSLDVSNLTDSHFTADLQQKGVDMRIGLDIATIALKKQADIILLVSGDSDFVPAAKLARREGTMFILDSLGQRVSDDLREHIDDLQGGLRKPNKGIGSRPRTA